MWSIRTPSVSGVLLGRYFWRVPVRCQHCIDPTALQSFLIPLCPLTEWDRGKDSEKKVYLDKALIIHLWRQHFVSVPKCTFNKLLVVTVVIQKILKLIYSWYHRVARFWYLKAGWVETHMHFIPAYLVVQPSSSVYWHALNQHHALLYFWTISLPALPAWPD